MKHDVHNFCNQFFKCKEAKTRSQPNGLYTKGLPTNISINFVISLGTLKMVRDSIFIVRVKWLILLLATRTMMQNMLVIGTLNF